MLNLRNPEMPRQWRRTPPDATATHRDHNPSAAESEKKKRIAILVPAFNESEQIAKTIAAIRAACMTSEDGNLEFAILVVDDGSADNTSDLAKTAGADRVIRHPVNRGLGAAVRTGLLHARHEGFSIVVKFDADLQHDPLDILEIVKPIISEKADVVYGYRFDRITYRMPILRRSGNMVFTWLMRRLTGWEIRDAQPGIFAVGSMFLADFRMPGNYNYTQQILLDAYHKGLRFAHVPVTFNPRTTGKSFISLRYPLLVSAQIFRVLVGLRPMRIFGSIGFCFMALAGLIFILQIAQYLLGSSERPIENVNLVLGLGLFGVQTFFFGALAQLIVEHRN